MRFFDSVLGKIIYFVVAIFILAVCINAFGGLGIFLTIGIYAVISIIVYIACQRDSSKIQSIGRKQTLLDEFNENVVGLFRASAPTSLQKLSDKDILGISKEVINSFKSVSERKGEHITADSLIKITIEFLMVYEMSGREFYLKHLEYELNRYIEFGLRKDCL